MIDILLSGCFGRMGRAISDASSENEKCRIVAGVDVNLAGGGLGCEYPVYENIADAAPDFDVIVDFSHHSALLGLLDYAVANRKAIVVATTGHTDDEIEAMKKASRSIPVFYSGNMSLGINLLVSLAKKAAAVLGSDFDVEIIEKHHNKKLDAPSGTALMIANAVSEALPYDAEYVYDRHSERRERSKNEIGIHSVRGGTIVGEHEVIFAGANEVITLSHSASSRGVFAGGALAAAGFIVGKPAGMYNMDDVVSMI